MPHLNTIAIDYEAKGIKIIAVNLQESLAIVQGYQDSYPDILFLMDNDTVWDDYYQNNYIPLNYVMKHDLAQTVEFWEEGYNETEVLGTINAVRSRVIATLFPEDDSYQRGDTLSFDVKLRNWTLMHKEAYVVVEAILPSGGTYRLDLAKLDFTNGEVKVFPRSYVIPMIAPTGDYRIRVRMGMPTDDLWSADFFDFTLSP